MITKEQIIQKLNEIEKHTKSKYYMQLKAEAEHGDSIIKKVTMI